MPRIPKHVIPWPKRDENDCLIWQGTVDKENGYPRRGNKWAHRVAYEEANGPIPEGYEVDHLCYVPLCVEPTHLEAVPPEENRRRVRYADECKWGHPLVEGNIKILRTRPNQRQCLQCHKGGMRRYKQKRAA